MRSFANGCLRRYIYQKTLLLVHSSLRSFACSRVSYLIAFIATKDLCTGSLCLHVSVSTLGTYRILYATAARLAYGHFTHCSDVRTDDSHVTSKARKQPHSRKASIDFVAKNCPYIGRVRSCVRVCAWVHACVCLCMRALTRE